MKRDIELIRSLLLNAEKSKDRYFHIGAWEWTDHDMRERELNSNLSPEELFQIDLMEQGGLIKKTSDPNSDDIYWEITWYGYEFLDAARSEKIWRQMTSSAKEKGVSLTADAAISLGKTIVLSAVKVAITGGVQ